ncbi:MAG: 5'/3'-nucleotidase SurE [Alphaproteobacteria bacterium]|nr:5'/3'-nucleotidase SurE [Alphaproteobacteria bacterium]
MARSKKLRVLVTNDDGIFAPGLAVMEKIAASLTSDVWVVAPEFEQSGAAHSLTLHVPLRDRHVGPRRFAIRGTPTDCVMLACNLLMKDHRPDVILSGVNRGSNLGEDVTYSGTVAAAMEGSILGIPSIALSQTFRNAKRVRWETALKYGPGLVKRLLALGWPSDVLININFPDVPSGKVRGERVTRQGRRFTSDLIIESRIDARNQPYHWFGFRPREGDPAPDTDLYAVGHGLVSVTPLHLDLTHVETAAKLRRAIG